jgi:hypothetical protein
MEPSVLIAGSNVTTTAATTSSATAARRRGDSRVQLVQRLPTRGVRAAIAITAAMPTATTMLALSK